MKPSCWQIEALVLVNEALVLASEALVLADEPLVPVRTAALTTENK